VRSCARPSTVQTTYLPGQVHQGTELRRFC
jgi:hypothetical protein